MGVDKEWLSDVAIRLSRIFKKQLPWHEIAATLLDPGDPRVVIRPLGDDWLCPFTGRIVQVPTWDGSSLTLLNAPEIIQHLQTVPEIEKRGIKARMKSWEDLVKLTVMTRIQFATNYKITSDKGEWICPHCVQNTYILLHQWDGTEAPMNWFVPEALKHLQCCQAYLLDPLGAQSLTDLAASRGEGAIRMDFKRRVATDPLFRICDDTGAWICPFAERAVESINLYRLPWGPAIQDAIVNYIMSPVCPARYNEWKTTRTVEELRFVAQKINFARTQANAKQNADKEMRFMKQRLDTLSRTAANVHELRKDLQAARGAQLKMLPDHPPSIFGYDIAAYYQPSSELGGDFYQYFDVATGQTAFLIGDVSGHGVEAAVIMSMALQSFGVRSTGVLSPTDLLNAVHTDVAASIHRGKFITVFYGILEHATGILRFARAGHPPAILVDPLSDSATALEGNGLALGIGSPEIFAQQLQEYDIEISPGNLVLLYTDGVVEAMNSDKEEFGEQRLGQVLQENARGSAQDAVNAIVDAVTRHICNEKLHDDITMVAIKRI